MKTKTIALLTAAPLAVFTMIAPVSAASLVTTFDGGNSFNGNIFDILVGNDAITLNSVAMNLADPGVLADVEFYYRVGTAVGSQNTSAGWTLFSTNSVVSNGAGGDTTIDTRDITFNANTRYGLYFTRSDGGSVEYTDGTAVGNVAATDGALTVFEGYGNQYRFRDDFSPRVVNAIFNYTIGSAGAVPEPATWAMMVLGMGAIGGVMRRRAKVSTTVRFA